MRVSINKKKGGATSVGKNKNVIIIKVDDLLQVDGVYTGFPARDSGGVKLTGPIQLKVGAKAIGLYLTPSTIARNDDSEGTGDTIKITSTFAGEHPGDHLDINELLQDYIGEDVLILSTECSNTTGGRLQGTPCNPMKLNFAGQDNNEAVKKMITATQDMGDRFVMGHYNGALPPLEAYATDDSSEDSGI